MRVAAVLALAAVLLAQEVEEEYLKEDEALLRRVAQALPASGKVADLLAKLEGAEVAQDRDVGFGARRVQVELYGGYGTCYLRAVEREGRVIALEVRYRTDGDSWKDIRGRILAAWGRDAPPLVDGFRHRVADEEGMAAYRAALGTPAPVEPPAKLRGPLELLTSPFEDLDYGTICYEDGSEPRGREAIAALVAARRLDLVRQVLHGPNPSGRIYAAEALTRSGKATEKDRAFLDTIRRLKIPITVCHGCLVSDSTAAEIFAEWEKDH